jgi:hypothetical protein
VGNIGAPLSRTQAFSEKFIDQYIFVRVWVGGRNVTIYGNFLTTYGHFYNNEN